MSGLQIVFFGPSSTKVLRIKRIIQPLLVFCHAHPQTQEHRLQGGALCIWALGEAIHLMDINDVILPNMVATEMRDFLQEHLLHWQGMSQECTARSVKRWKLRPKHHSLEEISLFVYCTKINPRFTSCFQDESYLGSLKRIGVKCHEATMLTRIYQRLMMLLSQRWEDTRKHARHAGQS